MLPSVLRALFPNGVVTVEATGARADDGLHPREADCIRHAGEKRRREFAAGRRCAREALARLGVVDFPLLPDEDRVPCWPEGFVGSISHCPGYVGVAVAPADRLRALGLDAEQGGPLRPRLAPRVCTAAERARFERLPRLAAADWPKLAFSAKEAFYKAYFPLTRSRIGFRDVEVEFAPADRAFTARLLRSDVPTAGGHRSLSGRYAVREGLVVTCVALPPASEALPLASAYTEAGGEQA